MKVLVYRPQEAPAVEDIPNTLAALQALVGGYVEAIYLPDGYIAVANEEGLLQGLAPSAHLPGQVLVGPVAVTKTDPADPEQFAGLTDADVAAVRQWVQPLTAAS